jgi:hypothetical protein
MSVEGVFVLSVIIVGVGATVIIDLWALFLRRALNVASLSYCLVGRWLLHMPGGTFTHASISAARQKRSECAVGWIAHYATGVVFAAALSVLAPGNWLARPTLLPALAFGIGTVLLPFLIMQPSFGLGIAASRTPNPTQARLKSLATHFVFGLGLFVSAVAVRYVLRLNA